MIKYDIITIGGAVRDIIFYTEEGKVLSTPDDPLCDKAVAFEVGAKIYIKEVYVESGGGAHNTAAGFSRLGLKTASIFKVGKDREGDVLIEEMEKRGVNTSFVQQDKNIKTGFSCILSLYKKKCHVIFAYRGANDRLDLRFKIKDLSLTKWIYVSSLSSPSWTEILDKIFKANKYGCNIVWNPGSVQLKAGYKKLEPYLRNVDILIINEDEARELVLSMKKAKDLSVRRLLKKLYQMGSKIVAITVGPRGAYAYDGKKIYYQREMPAKVVNATGAGDAFSTGFVTSLFYKSNDISQALRWGVYNSTSVIKIIGAQKGLLTKSQIKSL